MQETAYGMRISDWSSDVCSSDLKRTRTSTTLRSPAPEAGASTNSAIWARGRSGRLAVGGVVCQPRSTAAPAFCCAAADSCRGGILAPCPVGRFAAWERGWRPRARRERIGLRARIMQNLDGQFITVRSEEHTSELQSLMRISYAV